MFILINQFLLFLPTFFWVYCLLTRDIEIRQRLDLHVIPQSLVISLLLVLAWFPFWSSKPYVFFIIGIILDGYLSFLWWERLQKPVRWMDKLQDVRVKIYKEGSPFGNWVWVRKVVLYGKKGEYIIYDRYSSLEEDSISNPEHRLHTLKQKTFSYVVSPALHTFYFLEDIPRMIRDARSFAQTCDFKRV